MSRIIKNRLARQPMQEYVNRDYVCHELDERVFDILNTGKEGNFLMTTGCLDALDYIPAGSMCVKFPGYYDASVVHREIDAKKQKEIDDYMMSDMISDIVSDL